METTGTENITYNTAPAAETEIELRELEVYDAGELAFELGAWLSGLREFPGTCRQLFAGEKSDAKNDLKREFRLVNAALLKISKLAFRLRRTVSGLGEDELDDLEFTLPELDVIAAAARNALVLGRSLSVARELSIAEWQAWSEVLENELLSTAEAGRFEQIALRNGNAGLPDNLRGMFVDAPADISARIDIHDVLPRVGTALRFLGIIGRMHQDDEPLKPALLIFAAVHSQTQHMIGHINNRLSRFADEGSDLFNSLDSASYGASLELKKVFQQELRGIVGVLPPTSVYARIESAYNLLLDSFQQILIDFARLVDPKASPFDIFPRFQIKLDQSLILRDHLWQILTAARAAEESPEEAEVERLKKELTDFVGLTIRFLHYKDEETFERFNEEVHAAPDKKDLVPLLHRFGAYLETLFGQVCMRGVLADHPFEQPAAGH